MTSRLIATIVLAPDTSPLSERMFVDARESMERTAAGGDVHDIRFEEKLSHGLHNFGGELIDLESMGVAAFRFSAEVD